MTSCTDRFGGRLHEGAYVVVLAWDGGPRAVQGRIVTLAEPDGDVGDDGLPVAIGGWVEVRAFDGSEDRVFGRMHRWEDECIFDDVQIIARVSRCRRAWYWMLRMLLGPER